MTENLGILLTETTAEILKGLSYHSWIGRLVAENFRGNEFLLVTIGAARAMNDPLIRNKPGSNRPGDG